MLIAVDIKIIVIPEEIFDLGTCLCGTVSYQRFAVFVIIYSINLVTRLPLCGIYGVSLNFRGNRRCPFVKFIIFSCQVPAKGRCITTF